MASDMPRRKSGQNARMLLGRRGEPPVCAGVKRIPRAARRSLPPVVPPPQPSRVLDEALVDPDRDHHGGLRISDGPVQLLSRAHLARRGAGAQIDDDLGDVLQPRRLPPVPNADATHVEAAPHHGGGKETIGRLESLHGPSPPLSPVRRRRGASPEVNRFIAQPLISVLHRRACRLLATACRRARK